MDFKDIAKKKLDLKWEAFTKTEAAQNYLIEIENLLLSTCKFNWEQLKDFSSFNEKNPADELKNNLKSMKEPPEPKHIDYPPEPQEDWEEFKPQFSLLSHYFIEREKKIRKILFEKAHNAWKLQKSQIDAENERLKQVYEKDLKSYGEIFSRVKEKIENATKEWEAKQKKFYENQLNENRKIDVLKIRYFECDPNVIMKYCELILTKSPYPNNFFTKNFNLDYNENNRILLVEYFLPSKENFQTLSEVKYLPTKNELKFVHLSESYFKKMFDATMYKITLRSLYELFEADEINALEAINFNGWINSLNKATGKRENICILSIQVKKEDFLDIDLNHVDPKACFKYFKGVGSTQLSGITAIQPIMQIDKKDKRFVNSYEVIHTVDNATNLALMDWEDFEHLVRELFEKEFSANGGEVKVTQASRDGGVDAIAFDPDPIRGGKIVIQAKRYTNTVGVSAVRDLYGTVLNEGAMKGILVTTTDYGTDAYEFAKGKPLTLFNGSNLLHLLEKHGHKARIDLKEAKRIMLEK